MLSRMYLLHLLTSEPTSVSPTGVTDLWHPHTAEDLDGHTPLEWNTLFLGAVEHFSVLPDMTECLRHAHIFNRKHCGVAETKANLNRMYPGHRIHLQVVQERPFMRRLPKSTQPHVPYCHYRAYHETS